jgi:hypothetical protein
MAEAALLPDSAPSLPSRLEDADFALSLASSHADAGPTDNASLLLDAGSPALAEVLPSSTQPKGSHMRTRPPATNTPVPPEPEKPRRSGPSTVSPLVGMVTACALAGGCATSEPVVRQGPPPLQQCPPGSDEAMEKELGIDGPTLNSVWMPGASKDAGYYDPVVVTEGRHEVLVRLKKWGNKVPKGSAVVGDFYLRDRLYGRFVELRLPDGRRFPFCGYLVAPKDGANTGAPFLPGSTPGSQKVGAIQEVVTSFDEH